MTYSFPQRFLEEDSSCEEYGCSYSKDGAPGEVYCFKDGSYQIKAGDECPADVTGICKALATVYVWVYFVNLLFIDAFTICIALNVLPDIADMVTQLQNPASQQSSPV